MCKEGRKARERPFKVYHKFATELAGFINDAQMQMRTMLVIFVVEHIEVEYLDRDTTDASSQHSQQARSQRSTIRRCSSVRGECISLRSVMLPPAAQSLFAGSKPTLLLPKGHIAGPSETPDSILTGAGVV